VNLRETYEERGMKIEAIRTYRKPKFPTREAVALEPQLLEKHLPGTWKLNGIIVNAILAFAVASCARNDKPADKVEQKQDENKIKGEMEKKEHTAIAPLFIHGSGEGAIGCVVVTPPVFLTEYEARMVIERELEKAGIECDRRNVRIRGIKFWSVENDLFTGEVEKTDRRNLVLDGMSTKKNFGYEFLSGQDFVELRRDAASVQMFDMIGGAEFVRELLQEYGKINAAVFYDPLAAVDFEQDRELFEGLGWKEIRRLVKSEARKLLRKQVEDYVEWVNGNNGRIEQNEDKTH
jgi:hypothetical protein